MFACKRSERATPASAAVASSTIEKDSSRSSSGTTNGDNGEEEMPYAKRAPLARPKIVPPLPSGTLSLLSSSSASGSRLTLDYPPSAASTYMTALRNLQQLIAELLDVHTLSSAIEYHAHAPLTANAREWWRDVQQKSIVAAQRRRRGLFASASASAGSSSSGREPRDTVADAKQTMLDLASSLDGDAHELHEVFADALFRILQTLDRVNRTRAAQPLDSAAVRSVVQSADDAIAYAAGKLLARWDAICDEQPSASASSLSLCAATAAAAASSVAVINMLLQFCGIGSLHAFHAHVLVASSVRRVFARSATTWKCSVCARLSDVKGPAAPPVVYRCAACAFNLCRECFTRIPNQSARHAAVVATAATTSGAYSAVYVHDKRLATARFFTLAFRTLEHRASFARVAGRLACELRQRVKELPVHRTAELAASGALLVDMLACPSFALQVVQYHDCDWFPVYMNTWMMGFLSFLGPFVRGTSITDELRSTAASDPTATTAHAGSRKPLALSDDWRDGYHAHKETFLAIMRALLAPTQHLRVAHATLAWLGCTVLSTTKRRRMSRETNDMLDGFLINVSTVLVNLSLPNLDADTLRPGLLDAAYHTGSFSMRAFGDKDVREAPLRDLASLRGEQYMRDQLHDETERQRTRDRRAVEAYNQRRCSTTANASAADCYYPIRDAHYGVACNHCYQQNFDGVRYKCAFCDDVDICATCFAIFARQSQNARGHIDNVLATGLDAPQVHMLDHVFLRVGTPVPLYETRHFEMLRFDKDRFRRPAAAATDAEAPTADALLLQCADCSCSLEDAAVAFKCSNCFDSRVVCAACVVREEAARDPHCMHVAGHLYFAITSAWRFTYSPTAPGLQYRSLSHPSALLPRVTSNQATELLYMAIKALHYGPLLTLSKLIGVLKELQDLQAFCYCEEERLRHDTKQQQRRSSSGSRSRRPLKLSSHYSSSKVRIADLSEKLAMTELHLLNASNVAEWLAFYSKTCRWLLRTASPSQDPHAELLTDLSDAFAQFPEHFVSDLCDVVYLLGLDRLEYRDVAAELAKLSSGSDESHVVEPIAVMLTQLIASRELTRNPHVRVQALKALVALFAFFSKRKHNASVRTAFERAPVLRACVVPGVLTFHAEMEKYHVRNNGLVFNSNVSSGDHLLWGFLPTRVATTLLLRYLWQLPSQRRMISTLLQLTSPASPVPTSLSSSPSSSLVPSQLSALVSGLWSDVAKLLDEGMSKIETLLQLRELQDSALDGRLVAIPFRPAMMDGYVALHAKQLRLTFRMLTEALELLSWMSDCAPFKRVMLKPELAEQCARIVSFVLAALSTAHEAQSWRFSAQLMRDGKLVLANVVVLVVRCAGLSAACPASSSWKLIHESGTAMASCIGDPDTRERWALNAVTMRLESAHFLCETVDDESATDDGDDTSSQDDDARVLEDTSSGSDDVDDMDDDNDDLDEDAALARLEKQAADAVVAARTSAGMTARSRRANHAQSIARHLGRRFVSSLAKDGRFDYARFVNALEMLRRRPSRSLSSEASPSSPSSSSSDDEPVYECVDSSWVLAFRDALKQCREMIALHASMDAFLGEIPDKYLDPLLSTIMMDPVRLPSGQVVDRAVIERHLLSSQQVDPFTREPLTVDMLVPCDALRHEIRLYLRAKMQHFHDGKREDVLATWGLGWDYLFDDSDCAGGNVSSSSSTSEE